MKEYIFKSREQIEGEVRVDHPMKTPQDINIKIIQGKENYIRSIEGWPDSYADIKIKELFDCNLGYVTLI